MVEKIEGINKVKRVTKTDPNGLYNHSHFLEFEDADAHEVYLNHPNHAKLIEMGSGIVKVVLLQEFQ